MSHPVTSPSVLVVGGSLVGLSSAMFLAARGVRTIVVERHAGSSAHPRAMGFTSRTMELFRSVGIASKIPQAGPGFKLTRVVTDKVTSKAHQTTEWTQTKQKGEGAEAQPAKPEGGKPPNQLSSFELYSPYTGAAIAQDKLEPILRARAKELGVEFHLSTELVSLKQDDHGVIATVRPRDGSSGDQNQGDSTFEIRADYAVAADGAHSPIRESLGIGRSGPGQLRVVRSVLFRSYMLNSITAESGIHQWDLKQPDLETFLTTYGDSRWLLIFPENQLPAQADDSQLHALIRQATGVADLDCHTLAKGRWELAALVADRFRIGRILLAGDAAHALPPNRGGYGANTGIEDAHNLAWKLAAILQGQADASLLDSYEEERRPIALLRMQQIFARADYKAAIPTPTSVSSSPPVVQLEDVAMEFGQLYRSGAIVESDATVDVTTLPPAARPDQWAGQTGTRAPHLWVTQVKPGLLQVSATQNQEVNSSSSTSARSSTLDLFAAAGWTLLTSDASWRQTVELVSSRLLPTVVPLNCIVVGTDIQVAAEAKSDAKGTTSSNGSSNLSAATAAASVSVFESTFGWHSQEGGATLVRPDGYIAWRVKSKPENPTSELENALRRALQNNRV